MDWFIVKLLPINSKVRSSLVIEHTSLPDKKPDRIVANLVPQLYKNMCRRFIVSDEK